MANSEVALPEHMQRMDKVMELYFKSTPIKHISQQLNLTRAQVLDTIDEWKQFAINNRNLTDRAAEVIHQADGHFGQIIDQAWAVADTAEQAGGTEKSNLCTVPRRFDRREARQDVEGRGRSRESRTGQSGC